MPSKIKVEPIGDSLDEKALSRLEKICDKNGNEITPETVLADAEKPSSPLHQYFTWDNTEAAQRFRLIEAGRLISRIRVKIIREERQIVAAKYTRLENSDAKGKVRYVPTVDMLSDDDLYQKRLSDCKTHLASLRKEYSDLLELRQLWGAIDNTLGSVAAQA
jgi:hypothetical protein